MASVDFIYQGDKTNIQCDLNETINAICQKFLKKSNLDENSVYFLLSADKIDENMKQITLGELIKKKNLDSINILVYPNIKSEPEPEGEKVKSKYIICPECKENIKIKINDYKIYLYDCKNGHKINSILFDDFDKTQKIDISKIKCDECKEVNKSTSYNNDFFICFKCGKNLCPLCKKKHDKNHSIANYDEKDFKCEKHNDSLIKYCKDCKKTYV